MALHADADHRDLGHIVIGQQGRKTDGIARLFQHVHRGRQLRARHGEGDIGLAFTLGDILDDHVDIDIGIGQRPEDAGHHAGLVGHAHQRDLGFTLVGHDAGDQFLFHLVILVHHQRARRVGEARQHLHNHFFLHGQFDRPRLQHLGAHAGQFQHFFIGDAMQFAGARHDARIGRVDAIHISIDVAAIRLQRRRHRHRRRIGPATAQRCHPLIRRQPLKARHHRHFASRHACQDGSRLDILDAGHTVGAAGADRQLPTQPAARLNAQRLQRDGQQAGGDLLASGHHHVIFGRIGQRRGFAAITDQPIRLARHGRDHHGHFVAGVHFAFHPRCNVANPLRPRHRGATKFHHDPGHCRRLPL